MLTYWAMTIFSVITTVSGYGLPKIAQIVIASYTVCYLWSEVSTWSLPLMFIYSHEQPAQNQTVYIKRSGWPKLVMAQFIYDRFEFKVGENFVTYRKSELGLVLATDKKWSLRLKS